MHHTLSYNYAKHLDPLSVGQTFIFAIWLTGHSSPNLNFGIQ